MGEIVTQGAGLTDGKALFGGSSGKWAGEQLMRAAAEGKKINAGLLRTLDTLRHEEWKYIDSALLSEAMIQLKGVADVIAAGLTIPVPDSLGKTVMGYEKVTFMDEATVSLDGITRTNNDTQEFEMPQIPLPITHKDFFLNLRRLIASRDRGEPIDTTQIATAGRVCAEKQEKMLFQGGPSFGGLHIYGLTTEPNRNSVNFGTNGSWDQSAKTGQNFLDDLLSMIEAANADRFYGPFNLYVPRDAGVNLENDFKDLGTQTIRQRLSAVDGINKLQVVDQLPSGNVVLVQMTKDVVAMVQGENLQTVQWDIEGGFHINFKAFQIQVPLIRSDIQGRSGVVHMTAA